MERFDEATGFLIADPDTDYFKTLPNYTSLIEAAKPMILSASGWRKIFAVNGKEESITEHISSEDYIIAAIMALSFTEFLKKRITDRQALILIGMDSRFTGPAIADAMT
ncbi:MAG: phosphoglucomutase, partial [Spirochaetales bacterium]|nr:phosphoglucomutase [Spirochaetales bacterium]